MSLNKENRSTRRANGSLLSVDRTSQSQSEEFFTDSVLDASKIPTPSPKKQPFHRAYRERRALGNSRALKTAWQSSAQGSFSDSDGPKPSAHLLRPTKLPSPGRSPSPLRQIGQIDGTSTPPPELSPTSPSIVSSPAHGLDETYKRIAEEEDIAAQEGEFEDEEEYTDEMYHNNGYGYGQDVHHEDGWQADDQPPESGNAYGADRDKENVPLEDGTAPTNISGISFLEGLTDQGLAAKLTPHAVQAAKDRALLEKATQRQTPINFKGVKNGPTLSERLQRRSTSDVDESPQREEVERPRNDADDFQEPPPNVPKSWAKQRPAKDWMSRSRQKREQGRNGLTSPGQDSSQVDWAAAAADTALPSVEDHSTPKVTTSRNSSPASLHSQKSLDRVRPWDLNDFTGQSLQVSDSPPVRPRMNATDQFQQREIERLEKQAVTTNRLGQYQRRDPNVLIRVLNRGRSTSIEGAPNTYPTPGPSATPPLSGFHPALVHASTPSASATKSKAVKFIEDGEPIPNTPVVVYRSSSSSSNGTLNEDNRPYHDRKASEDRLARLARAMSNSPKPGSTPEDQSSLEPPKETPDDGNTEADGKEATTHDTLIDKVVQENQEQQKAQQAKSSHQSSNPFAEEETTPKANKIVETAKTPKVTGGWTDTILPDTISRTIRKQTERQQHAQTPHVSAGGWIETPAPAPEGKRQSSALAPIPIMEEEEPPVPEGLTNGISKPHENPQNPQPEAPKSALSILLSRAKSRLTAAEGQIPESNNTDTLHLNDSTINSLEDLLTLDNAELTTLIRMGAESEAREQLIRDHLGGEQVEESELLERLSGRLNALRTNIHDARKGIGRLEQRVSVSAESGSALVQKPIGVCSTCGSAPSGYLIAIHLPLPFTIPHLLHARKPSQILPRPTWLGWLTILLWAWFLIEQVLADSYGHPLYMDERTYNWPSEPEPHFPTVLPSMLWRWVGRGLLPGVLGPVWWMLVAIFRASGQALGWTDGFVNDGAMAAHGPSLAQVLDGLEDVVGMDADVFL